MKVKNLAVIIFLILIIGSIGIITGVKQTKAESQEIFVDDDYYRFRRGTYEWPYETIQYAIDVANPGDTIYVFGGVYNESLSVDKELTLVGGLDKETEGDTFIYFGKNHRHTITISADSVNFTGFWVLDLFNKIISELKGSLIYVTGDNVIVEKNNITNAVNGYGVNLFKNKDCLINYNNISNVAIGIYSEDSDTNQITLNNITECVTACVEIKSTRYTNIFNNSMNESYYGIFMRDCENSEVIQNNISLNSLRAIRDLNGNNNKFYNNTLFRNNAEGFYLRGDSSEVIGNKFINNSVGLKIASSNSIIERNFFNDSMSHGIICESSAKNNLIYQNHFYNCAVSAYDYGNNDWYSGTFGNIWSDYNEIDLDQNGIGDTPYRKNRVNDQYPLGVFLRPPNKPFNPIPEDLEDGTGLKITLTVNVTHPEGDVMDVYFYRIDNNNITTLLGSDKHIATGESASINFNLNFDTIFVWYANATDGKLTNQSEYWIFSTRPRPEGNAPPTADANGPYYAKVGEEVTFNGSGSSDSDGSVDYYRWNFGDTTSDSLSTNPKHIYESPGKFNATLTVIDDDGASSIDYTSVYVTYEGPQKPVATFSSGLNIVAAKSTTFDASASTDSDGTIIKYDWNFGDGSIGTGQSVSHTYTSSGSYVVTLTLTDNSGETAVTSQTITVQKAQDNTPGFEIIFLLVAIFTFLAYKKLKIKM